MCCLALTLEDEFAGIVSNYYPSFTLCGSSDSCVMFLMLETSKLALILTWLIFRSWNFFVLGEWPCEMNYGGCACFPPLIWLFATVDCASELLNCV